MEVHSSTENMQGNLLLAKVRQVLARNFGMGVKVEQLSPLIYDMKYADTIRLCWYSSHFFCRDLVAFNVETEIVTTAQGQLRGKKSVSALGRPYYRFQGIPYAKPPIGTLRFKDPQPLESWQGVRDALKEGPICAQYDFILGSVRGSEDCLFLNVFTPQLPNDTSFSEPKAVLVWVHGGGFQMGSGNAEIYSPDFFLEEDAILVTLNYRLGALGFLNAGTDEAPGNQGLKDVIMALKWIQQNIKAFGGDPARVCVFGESAGAAAVNYLLLSPLSKGLFSSAISQSGSALAPWAFASDAETVAFTLGNKFGCETKDAKVLVDYLRKIPVKTLAKKQNVALSEANKREAIPFAFLPSVEPESPSAFITKNPLTLLASGQFINVPYITGINEMEGMILLKQIMDKKPPASELDKDFERVVPRFLKLQPGSDKSKEVARRLRHFYFDDKKLNKNTYKEYIDLTTDTNFADPAFRTTTCMVNTSSSPVYNYEFDFDGNFALFKRILNIDIKGPSHADEMGYLFYIPIMGPNINSDSPEMKVTRRFVRLWSNFAKFGNPTPDATDPLLPFTWTPVTKDKKSYLELNENFSMKTDMLKERAAFWDELHKFSKSN